MANTQAMATSFKVELLNGHHAFGTSVTRGATTADSFKAALYLASATTNASNTAYTATGEVSGTNYTAGGTALTTKSLAVASNLLTFDADDITFAQHASGFTDARYAILYNDTGTPSTARLVAYNDLGSDRSNVNSDLVLQFPTGLFVT